MYICSYVDCGCSMHVMLMILLLQFCSLCHLEGDESQPHEQNQKILYSTGYCQLVILPHYI